MKPPVVANPWQQLRRFTDARIALGRTGASLPTAAHLAFQLAHAQARDAVHRPLDVPALLTALHAANVVPAAGVVEPALESAAGDRLTYLQRPDLGRRLGDASREALATACSAANGPYDLAFVIVDGLSALAVENNAAPLLAATLAQLSDLALRVAPLTVVLQGRVAIGDEVGEQLGAELVVVLIGERPGLSSPDSLGIYMTWQPRVGLTDAARNCISNVRPAGLSFDEAAGKLAYLITEARKRRLTGVALKDETVARPVLTGAAPGNFLLDGPTVTGLAGGT